MDVGDTRLLRSTAVGSFLLSGLSWIIFPGGRKIRALDFCRVLVWCVCCRDHKGLMGKNVAGCNVGGVNLNGTWQCSRVSYPVGILGL